MDVLFKSTLNEMGIADLRLEHTNTSLKGFGEGKLIPLGMVKLPITIGSGFCRGAKIAHSRKFYVTFFLE